MSSQPPERTYYLVETGTFESLLRTRFALIQSTLLFEHLCSQSDRPMSLIRISCEVLGWNALHWNNIVVGALSSRSVNGQMMYSAYDLIALTERLQRRKIQRMLSAAMRFAIR